MARSEPVKLYLTKDQIERIVAVLDEQLADHVVCIACEVDETPCQTALALYDLRTQLS